MDRQDPASEGHRLKHGVTEAAAPEHAEPILRLRGIGRRFGGLHAVRDVDLDVAHGERRVILGPNGRVFVTGPDVVRSVTGENVDMESLGGPDTHGRRSGVVHIVTLTEDEAIGTARRITTLFAALEVVTTTPFWPST